MIIDKVEYTEFFEAVSKATYQNQDILEAKEFGYKSVEHAFKRSELPWARFYLVRDNEEVLATIIEQRDGVLTFFTTTSLKGSNIREFIRLLRELSDTIIECRDVLFVRVATWHKSGLALLRTVGFKPRIINNNFQIWIKENGK